jgi:hypothetical protein
MDRNLSASIQRTVGDSHSAIVNMTGCHTSTLVLLCVTLLVLGVMVMQLRARLGDDETSSAAYWFTVVAITLASAGLFAMVAWPYALKPVLDMATGSRSSRSAARGVEMS